jgi:Saxitoxin biosynthesis operon protein SxtJ
MILEDLNKLKTGRRDLRKFGLVVGGVFALLTIWCWWRGKPVYPYLLVPAAPLLILGLVWPNSLKWVYLGWMSVALLMGLVVSTILLTLFFYLVVTPVGLLARAAGKDFLSRRLAPEAKSYWIPRAASPRKQRAQYERQF